MSARTAADLAVWELLRAALVARLAVRLGDPRLARRAAREAAGAARLLQGLDFPAHRDVDDEHDGDRELVVDDLLALAAGAGAVGP